MTTLLEAHFTRALAVQISSTAKGVLNQSITNTKSIKQVKKYWMNSFKNTSLSQVSLIKTRRILTESGKLILTFPKLN